jgi:hypothetical protein
MEILKLRKDNKILMEKDKSAEVAKILPQINEISKELETIIYSNRELQDQIKKKKEGL